MDNTERALWAATFGAAYARIWQETNAFPDDDNGDMQIAAIAENLADRALMAFRELEDEPDLGESQ